MRTVLLLLVALSLVVGCNKSKEEPSKATEAAPAVAAPAAVPASSDLKSGLDTIKVQIAAAKTGDDFLKVVTDCGGMEIDAATKGQKLAEDPEYRAVCKILFAKTRAELAIKQSEGGTMSSQCIAASMNLEDLINSGIEKEQMQKLLADLNKACGM